jgi:hypothetical protein
MKTKTVIYADEGKILTNGKIYGRMIFLADGMSEDGFCEITEAEYEEIRYEERDENKEEY